RKTGLPWISTVLAPLSFFSVHDPPIPPVMQWTTRLFKLLGPRVLRLFFDMMRREYKAEALIEFRNALGLSDYGNPMFEGQHSPLRVLAMFSKIFAAPQPDWP